MEFPLTVSTTSSITQILGNGVTSLFNFNFIGAAAADIVVSYTDATGATTPLSPSVYTLSLNAPVTGQIWGIGGSVRYPIIGSPIATGTSITIQRILPFTQTTSISNQTNFYPAVIEAAMDTLCMEIQQIANRSGSYRGYWGTGLVYNLGDIIQDGTNGLNTQNLYVCSNANVSATWAADLAAGNWTIALNVQSLSNNAGAYLPLSGGTVTGALTATNTGNSLGGSGNAITSTSTGSITARSLAARGADIFNVKDFGAVGDGATDDHVAIQAAINAAHAVGGGQVILPAVTNSYYLGSSALTMYSYVWLRGSGKNCTVLSSNASTPPAAMITANLQSSFEISDLQLQPRGTAGIATTGCGRLRIHDNWFYHPVTGVGNSIQLDVAAGAGAYAHYIHDNYSSGANLALYLKGGNNSCVIRDNNFIANSCIYIDGTGGANVFRDNLIQSLTGAPTGTGIEWGGTTNADLLEGNYFDHFVTALKFSATCFNNVVLPNHFDTCTNKILDLTATGIAVTTEINELGYASFGSNAIATGSNARGLVGMRGNSSTTGAPGIRTLDEAASGGLWDFRNGAKAAGYWSIRNASNNHDVIYGNGDNLGVLGTVQVQAAGFIRSGTGTPSGVVSGSNGDIFLRTDGTAGARLYVCSGTTVWAAVATV